MSSQPPSKDVTALLASVAAGDKTAADDLFPIVYDELHRRAAAYMQGERKNHTLQTTALIHEAYLRLVKPDDAASEFQNIEHFLATASLVMRRILVNHARAKQTTKRGGDISTMQIDTVSPLFNDRAIDLVALDEALTELHTRDPVQHRLVELRFFGGLTMDQCAELLKLSPRTLYHEWSHARAWLKIRIESE